jgi:DNA-binding GntR family transcriptional regulator
MFCIAGLFLPAVSEKEARGESYRFCVLVKSAALRKTIFRLDAEWAAGMRRRHGVMLERPSRETTGVALFGMNAGIHEGFVAASGVGQLLMAVQQQKRLRRFARPSRRQARKSFCGIKSAVVARPARRRRRRCGDRISPD